MEGLMYLSVGQLFLTIIIYIYTILIYYKK